ncbi:MAG: hypothetical protein LQ343_002728 [Gyalolechia ehrenbergii]|nr:MAG: hypothetical protein LQ343_002728 [Gyalolechia ehrenbergii]
MLNGFTLCLLSGSYTQHYLSSLASSSGDSSSPAALSTTSEGLTPDARNLAPSTSSSDDQSDLHRTTSTEPSDDRLLPPNPLYDSLGPVHPSQPIPGDGTPATIVSTAIGGISRIMARHRATSSNVSQPNQKTTSDTANPTTANGPKDSANERAELPSIRLVPHQDPRSNRPSLTFPPMVRTLPSEDSIIRVGRYSERDAAPNPPPNVPSAAPVGFKSKVVSRKHCEFWCANGQWFIKDVKSSSGTFLNHIRLSQPSVESRPFPVKDGDVVQLGIDFRGGEEMIFRCVKIRVECNRGWQKALNTFNVATHKRLIGKAAQKVDAGATSAHSSECAICLMSIAPCQALFVAPCSHVWHYKCIRPILNDHKTFPSFLCPNCRAVADLEADVDDPDAMDDWDDEEASNGSEIDEKKNTTSNGASPDAAQQEIEQEDSSLATMTSRQLSVRNGIDPPPDSVEYTGVDAPPPSCAAPSPNAARKNNSSTAPNLLNRRNARGITPPNQLPLPSTAEEQSSNLPLSQDADLPPMTPAQAFLGHGDFFSRDAMMGDAITPGSELGPMTPTNNAGPFVFDGSAGRDTLHRPGGTTPEGSNGVVSEA